MKRFPVLVTLLAAVAVAALCVGSAVGSSTNFKGSYSGKVTESVNGDAVTAMPNGKGTGTLIGKGTLTGTVNGTTTNPPCTPLSGPGTLKGSKGTLTLKLMTSRACAAGADDQNNITFSGTAKVTGGTGVVKKAKGSTLTYHGHYSRVPGGTGSFTVTLTGTLKH